MARMTELFRSVLDGQSHRMRAVRSAAWVAGAGALEQGLRFGRNMILTRVLAPEVFGEMAIVFAWYAAIETCTGIALAPAVVHDRRGHRPDYLNAVWWLGVARGVAVYGGAILACPLIARWYGRSSLVLPMRIVFASVVLRALVSPALYSRAKALTFRDPMIVQTAGSALGIGVTLALAVRYPSALALAIGHGAEDTARLALSHLICPFSPRLRINRSCMWSALVYTRRMVGTSVFTFIFLRTDTFVLGKTVSDEQLGYYAMAAGLAVVPVTLVSRLLGGLLTPSFAILQNDAAKMRTALRHVVVLVASIAVPLGFAALFFGGAILTMVYGDAYASAALPFGLITAAAVLRICGLPIVSYYFAIGKPQLNRAFTALRAVLLAATIYPLVRACGMTGAGIALLVATIAASVVQLRTLRRSLGLDAAAYLYCVARGGVYSLWVPLLWAFAHMPWTGNGVWHVVWCAIACTLSYGFAAPRVVSRLLTEVRQPARGTEPHGA